MNKIPRKRIKELLKQAGFLEEDSEKIKLLSDSPVPVLEIGSRSEREGFEDMKKVGKGELPDGKEHRDAIYQCLLLGKILGVKRWVFVYVKDSAWILKRFEVVIYSKDKNRSWGKVIFAEKEDDDCKSVETCIPHDYEVEKVAQFMLWRFRLHSTVQHRVLHRQTLDFWAGIL
jgi:hypothetical protein